MPDITVRNSFLQRLMGAAALDPAIYEEVEADQTALPQAMAVVVIASLSAGVGAVGFGARLTAVPLFAIVALMSWAAWALVTFEIGSRVMPTAETRVTLGQMLRTIGFSATPGFIAALGFMPGLTRPIFIVVALWMLASMVVAVQHALDFRHTTRAIGVCLVGWALAIGIAALLGLVFSPAVS